MEENVIEGIEPSLLGVEDTMLEGVVRRLGVQPTPQNKSVVKNAILETQRKNLAKSTMTRGQKLFEAKIKELDKESQRAIMDGNLKFTDANYYVRKQITGTGITEMLLASTVKRAGETNFDKNRLPELVNLMVEQLVIKYANAALVTDPADVKYSVDGNLCDAALLNGEISITAADKVIFEGRIAEFFTDPSAATIPNMVEPGHAAVTLRSPKLIRSGETIAINIKGADGSTLGANNHFLEVVLKGSQTRQN